MLANQNELAPGDDSVGIGFLQWSIDCRPRFCLIRPGSSVYYFFSKTRTL